MIITKTRALVATALTTGLLLAGAGTALADPDNSNPGTPPAGKTPTQVWAGVGADAFAELTNKFAIDYNATTTASDPVLASYDAVNPQTAAAGENIVTKPGCTVARPNGANGGLSALLLGQKSTTDSNAYCLDFVRASRAKKTDGTEDSLTFYAQSRDAVGYATVGNAYAPTTPLTTAQLKDIFECTIEDWSEVGGQKGAIHVYTQPSSAATYTFFLSSIGSSIASVTTGCGPNVTLSQQNDGRSLLGDPQGIAPYTISKWAAQQNAAPGIPDYRGGATLGLINTAVAPTVTQTLNGVDYQVLNPAFSATNSGYSRLFFNAVRTASAPAGLVSLFGPSGYLCTHQNELLVPFGNTPLGSDTGASTYCGKAY